MGSPHHKPRKKNSGKCRRRRETHSKVRRAKIERASRIDGFLYRPVT